MITRYRRKCNNLNVMRQSACLVFNPIMVDNYAAVLFARWRVENLLVFSFTPGFSELFGAQGSAWSCSLLNLLSLRFFIHQSGYHDLFLICP